MDVFSEPYKMLFVASIAPTHWRPRVSRAFKITRKAEPDLDKDAFVRLASARSSRNIFRAIASSAQNMLSGRTSYDYHLALDDGSNDMKDLGNTAGRRLHLSGLADWIEAPRDASNLPHIIQATRSQDACEREYAFGEMLKVVERLDPLANVPLIDSALDCVVEWIKERPVVERHVSMVLDPLPLLVDYANKHPSLKRHVDPLITYLIRELSYPAVCSQYSHAPIMKGRKGKREDNTPNGIAFGPIFVSDLLTRCEYDSCGGEGKYGQHHRRNPFLCTVESGLIKNDFNKRN
ncbi:hypothetical protein Q1695_009227 [Nippostrongylus brasiliensis]|nr:hypothetical protein Q1695_009227 [Nippostrongylus brasiliensis]